MKGEFCMSDQHTLNGNVLSAPALRLLQERNAADQRAVASVRQAAAQLCTQADEFGLPSDPAVRSVYLSLAETCFALQYRTACASELLCYEAGAERPDAAADLCRMLRHFVNQADMLTDGALQIGTCEIPHGLYALLPPERLRFVLLHLLMSALAEQPDANTMDLTAACVQNDLRLELVLRHDPAAETLPLKEILPAEDGLLLPDAPELLTERFCACYDVRILRQSAAEKNVCVLTLPAARAQNPLVKVSSDSAEFHDDTLFSAFLSQQFPTERLLTALAELS